MAYDPKRTEQYRAEGDLRETIAADILRTIYKDNPALSVYTLYNKYSLLDPSRGGHSRGDRFYVYKDGITLIHRPKRKGLDIIVYKDGKKWSAWEITNYSKNSYMKWERLYRYIKNLTSVDCHRFLVVSYPDNFRKIHPNKTPEYNIEWTEKKLAKNHIFLIYYELKHTLPEIIGWKDEQET
jgi:hypothetical protein